jgi:hypothetical protein
MYKEPPPQAPSTTIGNAAPLHLLLGFVVMKINCQFPPKQYQETTRLFTS